MNPATITTSNGYEMIVDEDDVALFSSHRWRGCPSPPTGKIYVRRNLKVAGKWTAIWAHRLLVDLGPDQYVDHINGNSLDNRRANLRVCSKTDNNRSALRRKDNTSGMKGVVWYPPTKRWKVQIGADGQRIGLGYFLDKQAAGRAYDTAARRLHGDFAVTNQSLGLLD